MCDRPAPPKWFTPSFGFLLSEALIFLVELSDGVVPATDRKWVNWREIRELFVGVRDFDKLLHGIGDGFEPQTLRVPYDIEDICAYALVVAAIGITPFETPIGRFCDQMIVLFEKLEQRKRITKRDLGKLCIIIEKLDNHQLGQSMIPRLCEKGKTTCIV